MKKLFKNYGWLFKITAAVFVATLAFILITNSESPELIKLTVAGIIILLGIIRVFPLLKTLDNPVLRVVNFVEILIDIGVGISLIIMKDTSSPLFGYLAGLVLYVRALVYFISVVIYKAKTDHLMFWFAIVLMTAGVYVASKGFTVEDITWFLFALALITALYLAGDGFFHYRRYRLLVGKISLKTKKSKEPIQEIIVDEQKEEMPPIGDVPVKKDDKNHPTIMQ